MIDRIITTPRFDTPLLDSYVVTDKLGESLQAVVYKGYHKHVPEYPLVPL